MKRIKRIIPPLLIAVLFVAQAAAETVGWEQWDDSVIRLLVQVGDSVATGTAFAVNDQGYYATNHHVVENASASNPMIAVESVSPEKKTHTGEIVWASVEKDLAIVRIPSWRRPPVVLGDGDILKKTQALISIGFPGGSDFSHNSPGFTEPKTKTGSMSAYQQFPFVEGASPVQLIEHDATINSGNSGGPLADTCGRVIGVNVLKASSEILVGEMMRARESGELSVNITEGTFFAINVNELIAVLKHLGIDYQQDKSTCEIKYTSPSENNLFYAIAILMIVMLLGFLILYIRLKKQMAEGKKSNSRIISEIMRRLHPHHETNTSSDEKNDKPYFDSEKGEIVDPRRSKGKKLERALYLCPSESHYPQFEIEYAGTYSVGSDSSCSFVIDNDYISAEHMTIIVDDFANVSVKDRHSTNGTMIEGNVLHADEEKPLKLGKQFSLAKSIHYSLQQY